MSRHRIASFDVFDTALVRRVFAPSEVFRALGHRLAGKIPQCKQFGAPEFVHTRIEAEQRARLVSQHEEITLDEIWSQLRQLLGEDVLINRSAGPADETAAEASVLGPAIATRRRVASERAAGCRIVFVSDTYLPVAFVREQLREHGFYQEGDGLYVSSERRVTKQSGRLFLALLKEEKVTPASVTHYGDNRYSDVEVPTAIGINSAHCSVTSWQGAELRLAVDRPVGDVRWLETAGRLRFSRCTRSKTGSAELSYVENQLGPLLMLFAEWLLAAAQADGVQRLFFASRDARLTWTVCQRLAQLRGLPIDCRYLRVSRRALLLPASDPLKPSSLAWLRRHFESATLPRILARLEFPQSDLFLRKWRVTHAEWPLERALQTSAEWECFFSILSEPDIAAIVNGVISDKRQGVLAYLSSEGVTDDRPAGFVDVGWYLHCFAGLRGLIGHSDPAKGLCGYFLAVKNRRLTPVESGPIRALFTEAAADLPAPREQRWLNNRDQVIEHVFGLADHPTIIGYDLDGSVRYESEDISPVPRQMFGEVETAVLAYVDRTAEDWSAWKGSPPDMARLFTEILEQGCSFPDASLVAALRSVQWSVDQTGAGTKSVVNPYSWRDTWHEIRLPGRVRQHLAWPEGSLLATPPSRKLVLKLSAVAHYAWRRLQR